MDHLVEGLRGLRADLFMVDAIACERRNRTLAVDGGITGTDDTEFGRYFNPEKTTSVKHLLGNVVPVDEYAAGARKLLEPRDKTRHFIRNQIDVRRDGRAENVRSPAPTRFCHLAKGCEKPGTLLFEVRRV